MSNLRLAVAALTEKVYVGRLTKDGTCFRDDKQDITSDFLKAVIDKFSGGGEITSSDGSKYVIAVRKVRAAADTGGK
jgi:hypothetical protein